ncbi:MAG: 50S ribosomal protein L11 methyltransferase [Clostridia bacterium]|nr:50S ribosomal protein L11 methyltransferase [Clostridia bacterium]
MDWTEITVKVPLEKTEEASAIANMTVPYGIYIEDYSNLEKDVLEIAHADLIDEDLKQKDKTHSVIHIYISECDNKAEAVVFLKERLTASGIDCVVESVTVNDNEWNENWKKYFKAFEIGERLAVCPSWEEYGKKDGRTVISLDPGAAFGTGGHATTSLCLEMLENTVSGEKTMLDIGTGSGILSIASALLGIKSAVGVDIDAQSVKTAKENAQRNGVSDKTEFIVGDLAEKITGRYDIVCANIVADVIIRLFDNVADYMKDDGLLIVSGIIDMRASDVEKSAKHSGFKIIECRTREEWRAYILKKQSEEN